MKRLYLPLIVLLLSPLQATAQSITLDKAFASGKQIQMEGTWDTTQFIKIELEVFINGKWENKTDSLSVNYTKKTYLGLTNILGAGTWEVRAVLKYLSGNKILQKESKTKTVTIT